VAVGGSGPAIKAGEIQNGLVLILDTSNGKEVARRSFSGMRGTEETGFSSTSNYVTDMQFSPDGKRLAVSDKLGAYLWDLNEGNVHDLIQTHGGVKSLAFSRDGKLLATGTLRGIALWDADTLKPQRTLDKELGEAAVAFSRDGKLLGSAEWLNRVHLWDVASGDQLAEDHAMMGVLHDVAFAPDDKSLAAVGEGGVKVWNIAVLDGKPALELRNTLIGHVSSVYFVNFSPDGKLLVTSSVDGSLKVWDAATGQQLATMLFSFEVGEAAFSPDGKSLATVGASNMKRNTPVPVLLLWKLGDLLDPNRVKAQATEAVAELFRLAETGKPEEPDAVFRQLGAIGPSPETTVPLLVEGFKSDNARVRLLAVIALRVVGTASKPVLPEIRKLLMDEKDPQVRQEVSSLLEKLESPPKKPLLKKEPLPKKRPLLNGKESR
jgi:WD40 repeat protein